MSEIRKIYDEIMADLIKKGFGGYVDTLNNYKNAGDLASPILTPTSIENTSNTKTQNESPATYNLHDGGASSLSPVSKVVS